MFFALSGFVLAYNHLDGRPIDLKRFWTARAARLIPAFLVSEFLIVVFLLKIQRHDHAPLVPFLHFLFRELVISCGFLQAWFPIEAANAPAWTLSCEVFFYLVFPLIALPLARLNKSRLRIACLVFALLSLAAPLLYLLSNPDGIPFSHITERLYVFPTTDAALRTLRVALDRTMRFRFFSCLPLAHLPIFLLGAAIGRYRRAFLATQANRPTHQISLLLSVVALIVLLCFSANVPELLLHDSLVGVLFSFCLLFCESTPRPLRAFLETKTLLLLGEASYALYILQWPFVMWWSPLIYHFHKQFAWEAIGKPTFLLAIVLLSVAVYKWVERPARLRIRRLAYGAKPAA
jgi:peptidoglycan/LPS O-acetylase OafA/YrhL